MIHIGDEDFRVEIDNGSKPAGCRISSPRMQATLDVDLGQRQKLCEFLEKFKSGKLLFGYPSWESRDGRLLMEKTNKTILRVTVMPQSPEPSVWTLMGMIEIQPDAVQAILEQV